jgi:hypothetical protein
MREARKGQGLEKRQERERGGGGGGE